jgi:hypothetical protein
MMTDSQQTAAPQRRRCCDQRVKRFRQKVFAHHPPLRAAKYSALVNSYSQISLLGADSYELLRARGLAADNGELRESVAVFERLIRMQLRLASALGLLE